MKILTVIILIFTALLVSTQGRCGLVIEIPYVYYLPDYSYPEVIPITWQGGEEKFGKWRQFFNGWEMGWGLAYNTKWNYQDNTWEGRDSGRAATSICSMIRFNVAEGNDGANTFEINFAKGEEAGIPPDWNDGAYYYFYDGNSITKAPAAMHIHGAAGMDTLIKFGPNEGNYPNRINIRNACDGKFYIEYEAYGSIKYEPVYSSITIPLMVFDNGFVGIGHDSPVNILDIDGGITFRGIEMPPEINTEETMTLWMDRTTGNVMIRIIHNGEVRQGAVVNFKGLPLN